MAKAKKVKAKKRCCSSRPRCKSCPKVLKKLSKAGLAEHASGSTWLVTAGKGQIKAARKGKSK